MSILDSQEMTDKDSNLLNLIRGLLRLGQTKERNQSNGYRLLAIPVTEQYADREAGLHDSFFRYYEPDTDRFVSQDLIWVDRRR